MRPHIFHDTGDARPNRQRDDRNRKWQLQLGFGEVTPLRTACSTRGQVNRKDREADVVEILEGLR
jgi:hypothetical protein